jgi:protein ImuB
MFACLYAPVSLVPGAETQETTSAERPGTMRLLDVARTCSPRVQACADRLVTLDVDGLTHLFGDHHAVTEHLRRVAAEHGFPVVHVAVAATQTAAILLASTCDGLTIVPAGHEAAALAPLPVRALQLLDSRDKEQGTRDKGQPPIPNPQSPIPTLARWGIHTLGQLAALPPDELSARLGQDGVRWQRLARGEDPAPLVPTPDEEVFEAVFEPEWPIEGMDPLAYVLDQLLPPLCRRLERRDRAAAVLHLRLRLVTRDVHARSLQLPAPMRDAVVLRTLLMLALEATPAPAGIDVVSITIDPTPGRVVQESLLTRAVPPPEHVATLMARLGALMGERRCGSPRLLDSHRPGAFVMGAFSMEQGQGTRNKGQDQSPTPNPQSPSASLRRFRLPVSARVQVEHGRPLWVRTERQHLQGGQVRACAGPWRTSGEWWKTPGAPPSELDKLRGRAGWNRDEWDVALSDGGIYRIFEDRDTGRWFVDGMVD